MKTSVSGVAYAKYIVPLPIHKPRTWSRHIRRENPKPQARIKPALDKPFSVGVNCHHCSDPPCVSACLTGAMHFDQETGRVVHDPEKCISCWTCIMVCPFGAVTIGEKQSTPVKCDFCAELDEPACVANCPNEALTLEEVTFQ